MKVVPFRDPAFGGFRPELEPLRSPSPSLSEPNPKSPAFALKNMGQNQRLVERPDTLWNLASGLRSWNLSLFP